MPLNVVCPQCARSFVFPDAAVGRPTTCQACGRQYMVPAGVIQPAPSPPVGGGATAWGSAAASPASTTGQPAANPFGGSPMGAAPMGGSPMGFGAAPQQGMGMPGAGMPGMGLPGVGLPGMAAPMGGPPAGPMGGPLSSMQGPGSFGGPGGMGLPSSISMGMAGNPGLGAPDALGLPSLGGGGLPSMGGGLPSLPTGGSSRPRFQQKEAPPWYANPWVWTGVGLGGILILGIVAVSLMQSNRTNRSTKPNVAAAPSGPVPKTAFFPDGNPIARPAASPNDGASARPDGATPSPRFVRPSLFDPSPEDAVAAATPKDKEAAASAPTTSPTASTPTAASVPTAAASPTSAAPGGSAPPAVAAMPDPRTSPRPPGFPTTGVPPNFPPNFPRTGFPAPGVPGGRPTEETGSKEEAEPPSAPWNLEADPIPDWTPPKALTSSKAVLQGNAFKKVLFARGAQPAVAVFQDSFGVAEVTTYVVPSGRKVGSCRFRVATWPVVELAPGGESIASLDGDTGVVTIYNTKTGATRAVLTTGGKRAVGFNKPRFEFLAPLTLAVYQEDRVAIWKDLKDPPTVLNVGGLNGATLTPGGKYLVRPADPGLRVVEVATGEEKGTFRLPAALGSSWSKPVVSDDGKEIVLFGGGEPARLLVVDFATGRKALQHTLDFRVAGATRFFRDDDPVQWLPDRAGWVLGGCQVVDRESGKLVWVMPVESDYFAEFPPTVLPTSQMLCARRQAFSYTLLTVGIPMEKIATAVKVVREGGEAIDVALPPLTAPDYADAKPISNEFARVWNAKPDPAGNVLATTTSILPTKSPVGAFRAMYHAPAGKGMVLANFTDHPRHRFHDPKRPPSKSWYECFETSSGRATSKGDLPNGAYVQAVSPSGALVATLSGEYFDRLDVWRTAGTKHVAGARPFGAEPYRGEERVRFGSEPVSPRSVSWVGFANDDVVWTLSGGNKLVCWKLPEFKAVAVAELPAAPQMQFSPNHAYLGFLNSDGLRWLNSVDGSVAGEMALPPAVDDLGTFRTSPNGERVAVLRGGSVHLGDMKGGHFDEELLLPVPASGEFSWIGGRYLLLGDGLYELHRRAVVWRYLPGPGVRPAGGIDFPDGRVWFAAPEKNVFNPPAALCAVALPDPAAVQAVEAELAKDPVVVLEPGSKVRMNVQLGEIPEPEKVRAAIEEQLKANGVVLADDAPLAFRLSFAVVKSESVTYYRVKNAFGDVDASDSKTVEYPTGQATMALEDLEGKRLWQAQGTFSAPKVSSFSGDGANLGQGHLRSAAAFLSKLRLPRILYLQPRHAGELPGLNTSTLSAGGATIVDLTKKTP